MKKLFILSTNCIITKGYSRSIICDLQFQTFHFLENILIDIIQKPFSLNQIPESYRTYINDLIFKDVFLEVNSENIENFPKMDLEYHNSSKIDNIIIEVNNLTIQSIKISDFIELNIKFIELRIEKSFDNWINLNNFLASLTELTQVESIEIYVFNTIFIQEKRFFNKIILDFKFIYRLYLLNDNGSKRGVIDNKIYLLEQTSLTTKDCGNISPFFFVCNYKTYTESSKYNTCLNCKVSINSKGVIKNCPSLKDEYGNVTSTTIAETIKQQNIFKYSNITKDNIDVCKDCEFRNICTDCRAFLEKIDDIYSKPLKCGYDPYRNIWEDWRTLPQKQEAIKYYGLT